MTDHDARLDPAPRLHPDARLDPDHWLHPDAWLDLGDGAQCGLWWRQSPRLPSRDRPDGALPRFVPAQGGREAIGSVRIGRIGRLAAADADAADRLLERACAVLRHHGCQAVLAPMEASTWGPYRVLQPGQSAAVAFTGESVHPPCWFAWLEAAGFRAWIRYSSGLNTDLARQRPIPRFSSVRIEPVDGQRALSRLAPLHQLVMEGFRLQPLFHPLEASAFARMATPWLERIDPRFSLMAWADQSLVGLLLAHGDGGADPASPARVVVRTLVVRPGRRWAGLGRLLLETCHRQAAAAGFTAAVHALMVDPGPSRNLSRPYAEPFRRYALMGRSLECGAALADRRPREARKDAGFPL